MNESNQNFTADTARRLAAAEKDRMENSVEALANELANDIINYVESVYKGKYWFHC